MGIGERARRMDEPPGLQMRQPRVDGIGLVPIGRRAGAHDAAGIERDMGAGEGVGHGVFLWRWGEEESQICQEGRCRKAPAAMDLAAAKSARTSRGRPARPQAATDDAALPRRVSQYRFCRLRRC